MQARKNIFSIKQKFSHHPGEKEKRGANPPPPMAGIHLAIQKTPHLQKTGDATDIITFFLSSPNQAEPQCLPAGQEKGGVEEPLSSKTTNSLASRSKKKPRNNQLFCYGPPCPLGRDENLADFARVLVPLGTHRWDVGSSLDSPGIHR